MGIFSRFTKKTTTEKAAALHGPAVVPAIIDTPAIRTTPKKTTVAWNILAQPLVSEKASLLGAHNQYVFVVGNNATKTDVRRAVHEAYGVSPTEVNIVRMAGKATRYGRTQGRTKKWKKAIVTLPKDKKIQVYEGV